MAEHGGEQEEEELPPPGDGEEGGDGDDHENDGNDAAAVDFNPLHNPDFMAFFVRMLQEEQATKDAARKKERRVVPELAASVLRSRRGELRALAAAALPELLARVGHNVWSMVVGRLEARDMARLGAVCWYFRALTEDDALWENIYAREVGGVSLLTRPCATFRERFFLCQKMDDLVGALATAEDGDEIVLCPGVYERPEAEDPFGLSGFKVRHSIHIRGCLFNQKYAADLNWNHPQDLAHFAPGNVIIRSSYTNALDWLAPGGSVTNVEVQYVNPDPDKYFFAIKVENGTGEPIPGLRLTNVAAFSTQQMALSVQAEGRLTAVGCRFYNSEGCGLSLLDGAEARLEHCVLEHNSVGISVNNGSVTVLDSVLCANRFSGCGLVGDKARLVMERCNVFHHRLQGVELLNDVPLAAAAVRGNNIHNNLNGILRWCDVNAETEPLQKKLSEDNNVHDNSKADVKVKIMPTGKNLADMADEANVCTFAYTGPNFVEQDIYHCNSCGLNGRSGTCVVCMRTCHQGHDVTYYARSSFYCDCAMDPRCGHRQVLNEKVLEKEQYGTKAQGK